jgi:hypothetical protein
MPSIKDGLSDSKIKELTTEQFKPGSVFLQYVDDLKKDSKMFIIIAVNATEYQVATVYINSIINENFIKTPDQKNIQYLLHQSRNTFLKYDSYADMDNIRFRDYNQVQELLKENKIKPLGNVDSYDFDFMLKKIRNSRVISPYIKRKCGLI